MALSLLRSCFHVYPLWLKCIFILKNVFKDSRDLGSEKSVKIVGKIESCLSMPFYHLVILWLAGLSWMALLLHVVSVGATGMAQPRWLVTILDGWTAGLTV